MSSREWREVSLEQTCKKITDGSHFSPKGIDNGYPMLTVKDMREQGFDYSSCKKISEDDFKIMISNDCVPQKDDLLVAKDGSYLKHLFVVKENKLEAVLSSIAIFRPDINSIEPEYLKYYIKNPVMKKEISENYVSGSAIPRIVLKDFKKIKILLPPLPEQKAIAHILSTLDEKIEVNNQINKTLENIAQTIFKQWFVDFEFPNGAGEPYKSSGGEMVESELGMIPKGWEVCRLGDTFNVIDNRGKTPPRTELETKYPIIDVKALAGEDRILNYNNCMKYVDENTYNNWFRSGHPLDGDILLSTVGSLAEMKIFLGDIGCIAQNVVALRVNDFSNLYLYQYLKYIKDELVSYNIGSVQPSIKITHIIKHKILKPNKNILDNFHDFASDITNQIYNLNLQNQRLKELRDSLLPKLMSGEIRVPIEEN